MATTFAKKAPTKAPAKAAAGKPKAPAKAAAVKPKAAAVNAVSDAAAVPRSRAKRLAPADRQKLMDAAIVGFLKKNGVTAMTREAVAAFAEVSPGVVNRYYGTTLAMKAKAIELSVVAGDIVTGKKAIADGFLPSLLSNKTRSALK